MAAHRPRGGEQQGPARDRCRRIRRRRPDLVPEVELFPADVSQEDDATKEPCRKPPRAAQWQRRRRGRRARGSEADHHVGGGGEQRRTNPAMAMGRVHERDEPGVQLCEASIRAGSTFRKSRIGQGDRSSPIAGRVSASLLVATWQVGLARGHPMPIAQEKGRGNR
jgi:hypothetical protein